MTALLAAVAQPLSACPATAQGSIPVTGKPVPGLEGFDSVMSGYMSAKNIRAGLLGIMKDGVIVYQRGFGWKDQWQTEHLRQDAVMRIASVTKPFTAAAVQRLLSSGQLAPSDKAFDLGQGGVLDLDPFPFLVDGRLQDVTVAHLLDHEGGWDRDEPGVGDLTYMEIPIGNDYLNHTGQGAWPPGREKTMRWILGQPLQDDPGAADNYSNVGFLALGMIVEEVSGLSHLEFLRDEVFGPIPWMPVSEVVWGRTFDQDQDPREPFYDEPILPAAPNVFFPFQPPLVPLPYGAWDHESRIGQGALVVTTSALLHLANNYYVDGSATGTYPYGGQVTDLRNNEHGGALFGTRSVVAQRIDGVNFAVIFNRREPPGASYDYISDITTLIETEIAFVSSWPTQGVDGQWVDLDDSGGNGSYEDPWGSLSAALLETPHEGTLNLKASSSPSFTGTIDQKVYLRAHGGPVVIGG